MGASTSSSTAPAAAHRFASKTARSKRRAARPRGIRESTRCSCPAPPHWHKSYANATTPPFLVHTPPRPHTRTTTTPPLHPTCSSTLVDRPPTSAVFAHRFL